MGRQIQEKTPRSAIELSFLGLILLFSMQFFSCVSYGFNEQYISEEQWSNASLVATADLQQLFEDFDPETLGALMGISGSQMKSQIELQLDQFAPFMHYFSEILFWETEDPGSGSQNHLLVLGSFPIAPLKHYLEKGAPSSKTSVRGHAYDLFFPSGDILRGSSQQEFQLVMPRNGVLYITDGSVRSFLTQWVNYHFYEVDSQSNMENELDTGDDLSQVSSAEVLFREASPHVLELLVRNEIWQEWQEWQEGQNINIPLEEMLVFFDPLESWFSVEVLLFTEQGANIRGVKNALRLLLTRFADDGVLVQNRNELREQLKIAEEEGYLSVMGIDINPERIIDLLEIKGEEP